VQAIAAVDHRINNVTETINGHSTRLADTINGHSALLTDTISARSSTPSRASRPGRRDRQRIDTRVAQFEDLLGSRVEAVAGRIESSGRQASEDLMSRAELLSSSIKSMSRTPSAR